MNKKLLDRLAALEARKHARKADKPPEPIPFGALAVMMIAAGDPKKRVRDRWHMGRESLLDVYARACRYKGTAALWAAAFNDGATFARKHLKAKPCWTSAEDIDSARQEIFLQFATEEACHQMLEAAEREGWNLIGDAPLSKVRPMRPIQNHV